MIFRSVLMALTAATSLAASTAGLSAADSYCVSCSGPQASYVCEVTLPDGVVPSQSPQLYCAYRLAAEGGHASCSSRRSGETPCDGDYKQFAYQGSSLSASPDAAVSPPEALAPASTEFTPVETNEGVAEPATGDSQSPPRTVVELTEQVADAIGGEAEDEAGKDEASITSEIAEDAAAPTAEAPRSTSEKIASAAKTALTCLTSLFEECE
jgi:hypothetical protein